MLTKLSFFVKKPLLIPGAQSIPTIGSVPSTVITLNNFAEVEEIKLLKNILGIDVYTDLALYVDANGIKTDAPQKYKDLVSGKTYAVDDSNYEWRGLVENDGLLASYIFCKWLESDLSNYTTVGIQSPQAENSERVSAIPVWVSAWRNFVSLYQGDGRGNPRVYQLAGGYGIDWRGSSGQVSLMNFLTDSDDFDTDFFKIERNENSYGI